MKVKSESEVIQSCPTLRDPMDCSPPGFLVHGIFQARILECRQHKEGGFLNFVLNSETKLSPEWRKFEGTIKGYAAHGAPMDKFWKNTKSARIAVTVTGSKTPVEFRNLEFVKDDSIGKPVPAKLAAYFDFSTAKPQNHRIAAAEGKGNIYSQTGVFVQEEQALRLASGAKLFLKHAELPDLTENFSFNMWVTLQRIHTERRLQGAQASAVAAHRQSRRGARI